MTIEHRLRELVSAPPLELEARTVVGAGAADFVAPADSPYGGLWVAWSTSGFTALTLASVTVTSDDFMALHRRASYAAARLPADLADALERVLIHGDTVGAPVDLRGVAPFQTSVLSACATIPPGAVRPYGWIAEAIGNPGSVRAVGTALARNPLPLVVPCHRVVRSDGSIGNYAFGSDMKREIVEREGAILT
jgi:methylated-DNA-[protein]-cysteine S-methyltransferase